MDGLASQTTPTPWHTSDRATKESQRRVYIYVTSALILHCIHTDKYCIVIWWSTKHTLLLTSSQSSQFDVLRLHQSSALHCTAKIGARVGSSEFVDHQRAMHFCLAILPFQVGIQRVRNAVGWPPVLVRNRESCCVRCAVRVCSPEPVYRAV